MSLIKVIFFKDVKEISVCLCVACPFVPIAVGFQCIDILAALSKFVDAEIVISTVTPFAACMDVKFPAIIESASMNAEQRGSFM